MGYGARSFPDFVQLWLDAGWLRAGQRLLEMGAQEFFADAGDVRREIGAFLAKHGLPQRAIDKALGNGLPQVRPIYEALGISYTAIDVDGAHGSTFFDLNTSATPAAWRGAFDFINNEGTIEHLVNPINGFHVAHEMAKVGGVIRHSFPLIGWREHGFFYPTTKFCAHLLGDNSYEVLRAAANIAACVPFEDPLFRQVTDSRGNVVTAPPVTNIWGELVYRKTHDQPFVIPVDHLTGPNADAARARLVDNYRRLGRLT